MDDLIFLSWSDPVPMVPGVRVQPAAVEGGEQTAGTIPRPADVVPPGGEGRQPLAAPRLGDPTNKAVTDERFLVPGGAFLRFPSLHAAESFLRAFASRREGMRVLRRVARERLPAADVVRWDDATLVDQLARLLERGRLRVLSTGATVLDGFAIDVDSMREERPTAEGANAPDGVLGRRPTTPR